MNSNRLRNICLKILLFLLLFALISLVIEIAFFNKDFFYTNKEDIVASAAKPSFDYYLIRHLVVFLLLAVLFIIQRKKINLKNLKPYSALLLLIINIIPGISFLSKYFFLFLSFMLFLYLKSNYNSREYKRLLRKNAYIVVFFLVLFTIFFPLLFKEGYIYDPLGSFINLPGYRLSHISGLKESPGWASDLFDAFLPQRRYTYQSLRQGIFPLWQYQKGLGESLYQQSYHPEKLISFIVRPDEALTFQVLLKLFLSMTGMYFLLYCLNIRNMICIIGGLAYAFSGYTVGWLFGPQSSPAYHIPFLFLFLIKYLKSKNIKFLVYFALWNALTIYSGFIAVAGYSLYAVALFLILYYLFDKRRLFLRVKEFLKISLYWALGIIMVSFLFVPLYYRFFISKSIDVSYRNIGRVGYLSPKYFLNIIFPFYHGWNISPEIRPYVSSIVILFLLLGLIFFSLSLIKFQGRIMEKEKYYILFFLLLIPFIMAMFGLFPFYQISCKLPILNSSPLSRLQSLSCFFLVILGAKGLEMFIQSYEKILEFYKKKRAIFWAMIEAVFLSSVLVAATSIVTGEKTKYHTIYPVFILLAFLILSFQISIILKKSSVFFLMPLLLLVSIELIVQNQHYITVNKKSHFITEIETPLINFLKRNSRKYDGILFFDSNYNTNGTLGNYGLREKIVHQFYGRDHKALIVDTFSNRSFASPTAPALDSRYTDFRSSFIQLLGVKYLIFRSEFKGKNLPPYYILVYSRLDGKVYKNNLYKKNNGIIFSKPKLFNPKNREKLIKNIRSMDYSQYVFIENSKKIDLNCKDHMAFNINIVEYTPNKVAYKYEANSDGIITFPEAFDKGWSVNVNGKKREVLKTNLIFRGVAVERGKGIIVFTYHVSRLFKVSGIVCLISLLLLIGLYLFSVKYKT